MYQNVYTAFLFAFLRCYHATCISASRYRLQLYIQYPLRCERWWFYLCMGMGRKYICVYHFSYQETFLNKKERM